MKTEHGSIKHDGIEIHILQAPYINGDTYTAVGMTEAQYAATGDDNLSFDPHYRITWDIADDWDREDESEACDWDNPDKVELV